MPFIDLHCDTASLIFEQQSSLRHNTCHVDLEKLHKGNYSAQWFAFFIHLKKIQDQLPFEYLENMYHYFLQQVGMNSDLVQMVTNYDGYIACRQENKLAAFLSIEEGQVIGKDIKNIDRLIEMGFRLMTLTWNYENDLGYPHHTNKGLTNFGKEVIAYLNHVPMLVDVSHLSDEGLKDIAKSYRKPIIASHSNARSYWNHTRNLDDTSIRLIANSGGIIGTNFYSYFLGNTSKTLISQLVSHIQHLYQIGGEDVLSLGTDFDGIDCELEVCNCSELDILINSLSNVLPSRIIDKLCYQNALRLIKENL